MLNPKFVAEAQGSKAKELFEQEGKSLYDLDHRQIPRLQAYFDEDDSMYLVQDYVEGENLLKELLKEGAFNEQKLLKFLRDFLPVLQYIHQQGLLHRDIKPENIMRRHKDGKIFLIDFGGAKQHLQTMSIFETALFTRGYAAYEQIMGKARRASDIYSLGATCVRLLTGCLPGFCEQGNSEEELYDYDVDELYDADEARWLWREKGANVREGLGKILDKMLEHSPKQRYQKVEELIAAIEAINSFPLKPATSLKKPISASNHNKISSIGNEKAPHTSRKNKTFSFQTFTVNQYGKIIKGQRREAEYLQENLGNRVSLEMVKIPGGSFLMGSPSNEEKRFDSEGPQHQVNVPSFYMGKYAIDQNQWQAIMGNNPARFKGENLPVENVSWFEAVEFCQKLSEQLGHKYYLPSESEWEYACRASTMTPFHFGITITTKLANYRGNYTYASAPKGIYREETTKVGNFPPNAFGLCDMHGNIWEWCYDQWPKWNEDYEGAPTDGSAWLVEDGNNDHSRTIRGGSWLSSPWYCRSAYRRYEIPDYRFNYLGFRVVCAATRTI
ncbi:MAG: bifunctional serine/threonine-protein kinase/formylglycine-generating enzyme family protein [Spirulinaceae cyanobacterium]